MNICPLNYRSGGASASQGDVYDIMLHWWKHTHTKEFKNLYKYKQLGSGQLGPLTNLAQLTWPSIKTNSVQYQVKLAQIIHRV